LLACQLEKDNTISKEAPRPATEEEITEYSDQVKIPLSEGNPSPFLREKSFDNSHVQNSNVSIEWSMAMNTRKTHQKEGKTFVGASPAFES